MAARHSLRIGGVWAYEIASWGELEWSTRWPLGCYEASWSMILRPGERPSAIHVGATVSIWDGSTRIWKGTLAEPNWSEGKFTADGLYAQGSKYMALDGAGNSTSSQTTAVDAAITLGLPWTRQPPPFVGALSTAAVTTLTDNINTITQLNDAVCDRGGTGGTAVRWMVDENGLVQNLPDPTVVTWHLAPGSIDLGQTDGGYASALQVRYLDSTTSTYKTNRVADTALANAYGYAEDPVDLTPLGPISSTIATQTGQSILAATKGRIGWTESIEVTAGQLTTPGGLPADLSSVRGRDLIRAFDVPTPLQNLPYVDLVVGEAVYAAGSDVVRLSPVDKQPRTLAEVTEDIVRKTRPGFRG